MKKEKLISFIFLLFIIDSYGQHSLIKKDSISLAIVQYGEVFLINDSFEKLEDYSKKLETLILNDQHNDKLFLIKLYLEKGEEYRNFVMDSLFNLDLIPFDLVNELEKINFYYEQKSNPVISKKKQDLTANSIYPSNEIYKSWDSKKIWNHIEINNDSSYIYEIANDLSVFSSPVCVSSMKKYNGLVTSHQGWRNGKMHNGVDINMDQWDSVQCVFDGKVRFAKEFEGFGKVVVVRHYNGLESLYAHLAKIKVKVGQEINSGELIGLAGSSGTAEGSHLHFELRFLDKVLNPENIIDFNSYTLRSDSLFIKRYKSGFVAVPLKNPYHIVERGDYPFKIANRYGLELVTFCELNNITTRSKLKVGERVIIE